MSNPLFEFEDSYLQKFGPAIPCPSILKFTGQIRDRRWLSRMLQGYIDDSIKYDPTQMDDENRVYAGSYADAIVSGSAPQRPGVEVCKAQNSVQICGFLPKVLRQFGDGMDEVPQAEKLAKLTDWWLQQTQDRSLLAYHIVFSLHPRLSIATTRGHQPVDTTILGMAGNALTSYGNRFYPNASLGWIIGFHSDRPHSHAHALLFPRTSDNHPLCFSDRTLVRNGTNQVRVHFREELARSYFKHTQRLQHELIPDRHAHEVQLDTQAIYHTAISCYMQKHRMAVQAELERTGKSKEEVDTAVQSITHDSTLGSEAEHGRVLQELRSLRNEPPVTSMTSEKSVAAANRLQQLRDEIDSEAASIRSRRLRLGELFNRRKSLPGRYRLISYDGVPFTTTPNGSRKFLGENPATPHADSVVGSSEKYSAEIQTRLNELQSLLDEFDSVKTYGSSGSPEALIGHRRRSEVALRIGWALTKGREHLHSTPPLGSYFDEIKLVRSMTQEGLTRHVQQRLRNEMKWMIDMNHSYSLSDLRRLERQRASIRVTNHDKADPQAESSAVLDMDIPQRSDAWKVVPPSLNPNDRFDPSLATQSLASIKQNMATVRKRLDEELLRQIKTRYVEV